LASNRTATAVVNEIKKMIVKHNFSKLPGEHQLSQELKVNRIVIYEAIKVLEYEGIVKSRWGSGTYIMRKKGLKISFSIPLEISTDNSKRIFDLLEVRRSLEGRASVLAVETATNVEI